MVLSLGGDMIRIPHADVIVHAWSGAEIGRPFLWGETNCVALALRALDLQAGTQVMDKYRRHMVSARRAAAWCRSYAVADIARLLEGDGFTVLDASFSQPGDIVLAPWPGSISAAVCLGGRQRLSSTEVQGVALFDFGGLAAPTLAVGVR